MKYLQRFNEEFWPFTKSKKQTKQETEIEVSKPTKPPREILVDLEEIPGFSSLKYDSRPDESKVWLKHLGTPIYLGFKEVYEHGRDLGVKFYLYYDKDENSIICKKDYYYGILGNGRPSERLEFPKGGTLKYATYKKKTFFEKGDRVVGTFVEGSDKHTVMINILDVRNAY